MSKERSEKNLEGVVTSLVPDVIGKSLSGAAEFKVGGKKHVKFDGRDLLYNVWCISQGKGTDVSRCDICLRFEKNIITSCMILTTLATKAHLQTLEDLISGGWTNSL